MSKESIVWTISANFINREDAVAARDLLEELGIDVDIHQTYAGPIRARPASETRLGMFILEAMQSKPGSTFNTEELAILCEENRYQPTSWAATISKLVSEGAVERIARGLYRLPRDRNAANVA